MALKDVVKFGSSGSRASYMGCSYAAWIYQSSCCVAGSCFTV